MARGAQQRIIVLGKLADGRMQDLSREATATVENAKIAAFQSGVLTPMSDGQTTVTLSARGAKKSVSVTVTKATAEVPVSFVREIEPILTKSSCNSGGCHGAQHGRGGFRLSLFGFDPEFDHAQIVQSTEGRRVVPSDPERSILLLKPSLTDGARRRRTT